MTPQATIEKIKAAAAKHYSGPLPMPDVYFFAVRGYWPKSMGPTDGNDVGIYDDAIFLVTPDKMWSERANTDPSRLGWNATVKKPMAMLATGTWWFRPGPHKGHMPSFRQIDSLEPQAKLVPQTYFTVHRMIGAKDRQNYKETGYFAINIHRGGMSGGTSSEGCQTIPRGEADEFLGNAIEEMRLRKQLVIPYILVDDFA